MKYIQSVEVRDFYEPTFTLTVDNASATARMIAGHDQQSFFYWTVQYTDGVAEPIVNKHQMYKPSINVNSITLDMYFKTTGIKNIYFRVYEEDPTLNPDAEFVTSNTKPITVRKVVNAPKLDTTLEFIEDAVDAENAILYIGNGINFADLYTIESIKIYDNESNFVLYDGTITAQYEYYRIPLLIKVPNTVMTILIVDVKLKDKVTGDILTSSNVCAVYPRFKNNRGLYSDLIDYMPFRTHNGKKVTKYPLISTTNPNVAGNGFRVMKSAVPVRNINESVPGATFERGNATAHIEYTNDRTNESVSGQSSLTLDSSTSFSKNMWQSYMSFDIYNNNVVINSEEIQHGDILTPMMTIDSEDPIAKDKLTATLCTLNVKDATELKFVSMPPIDVNKPYYEIKTYKSEHDFLPFGEVRSTSGESLQFTTDSIKIDTASLVRYLNDVYITISSPAIWYPDIDTIDLLALPNHMSELQVRPLITNGDESAIINSNVSPVNGKPLTISTDVVNLIDVNIGTHEIIWKKNGVVIPNAVSRYLTFPALSVADNGAYTAEYTITPRGIKADDSGMTFVSQPFNINVSADNPFSMTVDATPESIVLDDPLTVSGVITIGTNTIKKSILLKDKVQIKNFATTELNPTYTVDKATASDAGVYQFQVTYMDGSTERVFTSEAKTVVYDNTPQIPFTVDITVPAVDEGRQVTLVGKVTINSPPAGIEYLYQWHKGVEGAIVGENDKDLVIDIAIADDAGEYWLSVLAKAPEFASTLKASAHKDLVVRTDAQLRFSIVAESNIVADGKPTKLNLSFAANQQVSPEYAWYANGEIIAGSENKPAIEHIAYGDVIYYVKGKPTNPSVIPIETQSNILVVKGVTAVEDLILSINAPAQAGLGERVLFEAIIGDGDLEHNGNPISRDDYSYEWYKGTTKIGTGKEIRIYAASDASGDYKYKIFSKVDPTISKDSPVHKFTVKDETPVSVTLPPAKTVKVGETLEIIPTITPAEDVDTKFQWMRNGTTIAGATSKIFKIDAVVKGDAGVYTVSVTDQSTPTISTPCVVQVKEDDIDPPDPITGEWYIHDLRPGRNRGFTWMGWWVLDEIQKAINDNFDWMADPTNPRFKYQNVLKALVDNRATWEDIEIQESRNGTIILLSSLEVVGI